MHRSTTYAMHGRWKQDKLTQEDHRDAVYHCREKTHAAKGQLEFKLTSTLKDTKGAFQNILTSNERSEITSVHCLMRIVTSQIGMQSRDS